MNEVADSLNDDLAHIATWIDTNQLKLNVGKTQLMTLSGQSLRSKWQQVDVQLQGTTIPERDSARYLGLTIDRDLSWKTHVCNFRRKAFAAVGCIPKASHYLPVNIRKMLYKSPVLPHLDYCSTVWHSCNQTLSQNLEHAQNYAGPCTPSAPLRDQLHWTTLHHRRHSQMLCQVHRCLLQQAPAYLTINFSKNSDFYSSTRGAGKLHIPTLAQTSSDSLLHTRVPTTETGCHKSKEESSILQACTNELIIHY